MTLNLRLAGFVVLGAAAGYLWHRLAGCRGGCPITGNPYVSTLYGALLGFMVASG